MSTGGNKKIIPKFKKKLQGFLSDESGKISKEDVLKMSLVAMGLSGVGSSIANAASHSDSYFGISDNSHSNGNGGNCHGNGAYGYSASVNGHANGGGTAGANCYGGTASHANVSHVSHSSHGSHGQW